MKQLDVVDIDALVVETAVHVLAPVEDVMDVLDVVAVVEHVMEVV